MIFVAIPFIFQDMSIVLQSLLIMFGAWFLTSKDFKSKLEAEETLKDRKFALPLMSYEFSEKEFLADGEGKMSVPYTKIKRLVQDKEYLYIFLGKRSIFMIDKNNISFCEQNEIKLENSTELEGLKELISKESSLPWERPTSSFFVNLPKLLRAISDLKEV